MNFELKQKFELAIKHTKIIQVIESLDLEDLYFINDRIVDQIKHIEDIEDLKAVNQFRKGQKVTWKQNEITFTGHISKLNQKTLSIHEDSPPYKKWKIHPQFISLI